MNEACLILCGPTGTGKSELALLLAQKANAEIISADAFQVYRGLDIGTAKPTLQERQKVPHHLIDCLSPKERANAHWYAKKVRSLIPEIMARGNVPLIVGGSGLYIKAVLEWFFEVPDEAEIMGVRKKLQNLTPEEMYCYVTQYDPESARRIHPNDTYRLRRALEVYFATGKPISLLQQDNALFPYPFYLLGIYRTREELYRRIEERVEHIFASDFPEEVKNLKQRYDFSLPAFGAIGYRETADYLSGEMSLTQTKELIKQRTRNYAKRQMTWFRKDKRILWLNLSR